MFEELLKKAKKYGITKYQIGHKLFKTPRYIYAIKNPTCATLKKLEKAIDELIKEK